MRIGGRRSRLIAKETTYWQVSPVFPSPSSIPVLLMACPERQSPVSLSLSCHVGPKKGSDRSFPPYLSSVDSGLVQRQKNSHGGGPWRPGVGKTEDFDLHVHFQSSRFSRTGLQILTSLLKLDCITCRKPVGFRHGSASIPVIFSTSLVQTNRLPFL